MKKKLELLVLECPWSDDLEDKQSVRLFMQGWADLNKISLSYRMYYSARDLTLWLARFIKHDEMQVCYIAGHGKGGRLRGHLTSPLGHPKMISRNFHRTVAQFFCVVV